MIKNKRKKINKNKRHDLREKLKLQLESVRSTLEGICISFRSVVQWNSLNVEVKLIKKKVHQLKKKKCSQGVSEFITEEEENDAK